MSTRVISFCDECGWSGRYTSRARADYAYSRHSCTKKRRADLAAARRRNRAAAVDRTPKPCLHKVARHEHGTHACYVLDTCRCPACSAANSAYESARNRRNAYGRSNLVDAAPVRAHVIALGEAGVGLKRITALTGISGGSLTKLIYGTPRADGTRRPPAARVRKETAARLLAVTIDDRAAGALVDPTGTRRRVEALIALGWSVNRLATEHGIDRQNLDRAMSAAPVTGRTAEAVRAIYDAIGDTAAPETTHQDRLAASRSRRRAAEHGWWPPAMWDDDDIDDPYAEPPAGYGRPRCATPGCDRADIAAKGQCWAHYRGVDTKARVDVDEWAHLVRGGEHPDRAAARCGVTVSGIETTARNHERQDILRLLREARDRSAA